MDLRNMKPDVPPQTVFSYFRREYFKHKSKFTKETKKLRDAAEMWMSLNHNEREKFRVNFEESKSRYENEYAQYLENLEPFLLKRSSLNVSTKIATQRLDEPVNNYQESTVVDADVNPHGTVAMEPDSDMESANVTFTQSDSSVVSRRDIGQCEQPTPPPKDGKSLFMTTQEETMDKNQLENAWRVLPRHKKMRYTTAVKTLKKTFIEKYKIYLMSLSNKELGRHLQTKHLTI